MDCSKSPSKYPSLQRDYDYVLAKESEVQSSQNDFDLEFSSSKQNSFHNTAIRSNAAKYLCHFAIGL